MNMKRLLWWLCLATSAQLAFAQTSDAGGNLSGKVIETMTTAGYTYVKVDTGSQKIWAVTTQFTVTNGDRVTVFGGMPQANYHSKSLNRDFDLVYFTDNITVNNADTNGVPAAPALPPGHPSLTGEAAAPTLPPNHPALPEHTTLPAKINLADIKKATGGKTVQEIISGSAKLAGQTVSVRGKVVKYNSQILGKNWLHLQDGSGSAKKNDNDLTITSDTAAKLGDTVLVTGKVSLNKDFGANYKYDVIIEDAQVTIE